ncbi:unnamed protein product [Chilo suppressalis]|uniref:CCHC-type domain-containing protein n=1 Tax=Chilo suppressalis TaxID=168631 RepID=A0ABN8AZ40_CHISP|nr:unnamed protein product [Chilo suppressalis]
MKVDALAKRMEEAGGEYAEIGRPQQCADLKLTGLDESVTLDEVRKEKAKVGGCAVHEVTSGGVHPGPRGERGMLVRCPTWAAKKVAGGGKLKVGWSLAKVTILSRRVHCFRCMGRGHAATRCPAKEDWSTVFGKSRKA